MLVMGAGLRRPVALHMEVRRKGSGVVVRQHGLLLRVLKTCSHLLWWRAPRRRLRGLRQGEGKSKLVSKFGSKFVAAPS